MFLEYLRRSLNNIRKEAKQHHGAHTVLITRATMFTIKFPSSNMGINFIIDSLIREGIAHTVKEVKVDRIGGNYTNKMINIPY